MNHIESWRTKQILNWFEVHGKDFFRPLDIWDIESLLNPTEKIIHFKHTPHELTSSFFDTLFHWFHYQKIIIINPSYLLTCYRASNFFRNTTIFSDNINFYDRANQFFSDFKNVGISLTSLEEVGNIISNARDTLIIFDCLHETNPNTIISFLKKLKISKLNSTIIFYNIDSLLSRLDVNIRKNLKCEISSFKNTYRVSLVHKCFIFSPYSEGIVNDAAVEYATNQFLN
jgi:hypothetical protein